MIALFWVLVLAVAAGYGTLAAGWLIVPLIAALGAWLAPRKAGPLWSVPVGVVLGWAVLLFRASRASGYSRLAERLVGLIPVSLGMLVVATLLLGLALALGGALIGVGLARRAE